jgi:hypothetical protein
MQPRTERESATRSAAAPSERAQRWVTLLPVVVCLGAGIIVVLIGLLR